MKKKVKGMGGFFFLVCSLIMSTAFIFTVEYSRTNTAIAVSENIAHIVCTKIAVNCYQTNRKDETNLINPIIVTAEGDSYNPQLDFSNLVKQYGVGSDTPKSVVVNWNKEKRMATFSTSSFACDWGVKITPREQKAIIEIE